MKYILHVHGMHCNACVLVTESELRGHPKVSSVKVSLKNHNAEIIGDFGVMPSAAVAHELTKLLERHGYSLALERQMKKMRWVDFTVAIPTATVFIAAFILLQKAGIVNFINTGTITYGTAFIIGGVASLSTCIAVVGGLVLSLSATFAREGDALRSQLFFHSGRLVSFFVLGGVIGAVGSAFTLTNTAIFILNILVGLVMLLLGINLLDIFNFTKMFQLRTPKFIVRHAMEVSKINHALTPFLVGVVTFFLPCGFTQSMQLYALTTGSFLSGALTMFSFAVGTLPVLALISFSSFSIKNGIKAGIFFKTAGLIVIAFALFNLINSLVIINVIPPVFNF